MLIDPSQAGSHDLSISRLLSLSSFLVQSTRYCYCCIAFIDDNIYLCNITIAKKLIDYYQARIRVAIVCKLCNDDSNNYATFNRECLLGKLDKLSKRDVQKSWLPAWLRWVSIINKRVLKTTHVNHILSLQPPNIGFRTYEVLAFCLSTPDLASDPLIR